MIINVKGMMCCGCEKRVVNAFKALGIEAIANHEKGTVELNQEIAFEKAKETIEDLGFEVL